MAKLYLLCSELICEELTVAGPCECRAVRQGQLHSATCPVLLLELLCQLFGWAWIEPICCLWHVALEGRRETVMLSCKYVCILWVEG